MISAQASIAYTVQRPGGGSAILNACRALALATPYDRLTGLYAFASLKGARLLIDALKESPSWRGAKKRWIVSIDGGVTEPGALKFLLSLPKAEVRVPYADELLKNKLKPLYRFHPKTLLLEQKHSTFVPAAIIVGSANLTCSGLCFGHEHAISATIASPARSATLAISSGIEELEKIIISSKQIDHSFVEAYAKIRPKVPVLPEHFEDKQTDLILQDRSVIPAVMAAALAAAAHFWIDIDYVVTNRGRGEEGNQIDMQRGSRVFFGFGDASLVPNSSIGSVRIVYKRHSTLRNLRFGNNSMDKLDLPLPGLEGPQTYRGQTLLFTKGAPGTFHLSVGDKDKIRQWKSQSSAHGTLFKMRSGREFGVF